ncbi:hypothetical protein RYH74_07820 [Pseudomonas sp. LSJ-87]|uniref:hypothetical protein n=1 Tax=Pseudomonas sp. LSJ-87 TaxID=3079932 RepID=UPI00294022E3|nr:hypothetical protein [Pseudomonas sp. LSJ-87]MDV5097196.1 hypothetical protein [Pseudomonas sp. LSJ-87]
MDNVDLMSPITYDDRLVIFFDVMGWKSHIAWAGDDPFKVGMLSLMPKLLKRSSVLQGAGSSDARITAFSDCCVVSIPFSEESLPQVLYGLSNVFVGAAMAGFLLRAGATIGKLHHENDIVFGPGLNVAHGLESNGFYPRIILDKDVPSLKALQLLEGMKGEDEYGLFVDPFTLPFVKSGYLAKDSYPDGTFMGIPANKATEIYTVLLMRLEEMLGKAGTDKSKKQVNWLYARVRQQHKQILGG